MNIESIYLLQEDIVDQRLSRGTKNPSVAVKKTKKASFYKMVKERSKKSRRKWVKLEDMQGELPLYRLAQLAKEYQAHNYKFRRLAFETINGKLHIAVMR